MPAAAAAAQLHSFIAPQALAASEHGIAPAARKGLFARFMSGIYEARSRQAEREIANLIELKGGRLTDDIERQIERRFI